MQSIYNPFTIKRATEPRFAPDYAIQNHLTPFVSMQNHHSLIYREEEREMFPTLKVYFRSLTLLLE